MLCHQFNFIIALSAAHHVLSNTVALSTMLSGTENADLIDTAQEARVLINIMRAERSDPSVWKEVYERGETDYS